jgi:hypothetical protein
LLLLFVLRILQLGDILRIIIDIFIVAIIVGRGEGSTVINQPNLLFMLLLAESTVIVGITDDILSLIR